jgi:hypothetical protein
MLTHSQSAFLNEEVERIVLAAVDTHLKDQAHDETKVARWVDAILETCMQDLAQLCKPFKYMGKYFDKRRPGEHRANSVPLFSPQLLWLSCKRMALVFTQHTHATGIQ